MKSRWQGIYTIILCCLMIFCSVSLITGCKSKETTPQQFFIILDGNETKIDNILMETSQGREHFEKGRKDCVELHTKIEEQIKDLGMEENEKLAEEVKILYTNERQRLEYMRAMFNNEDDMNNLNRVVKSYKEFEEQAKTFRDKYKISDKFTYKKVREEAECLEKDRIRKAKEERAKRIAANKREIIAYRNSSDGEKVFIPTNSIKLQNGEICYMLNARNNKITTLEVIIDYNRQLVRLGMMRTYNFANRLIESSPFPSHEWYDLNSPPKSFAYIFVKTAQFDIIKIKEYLQSIEEWEI